LSLVLLALLFCTLPLHADDRAVVHKIAPVYPEMAKRMHITGTVRVVTTVDASGAVTKVEGLGSNKTVTIQINFDN
jgi:outer membrane biosynthesis protein TonB